MSPDLVSRLRAAGSVFAEEEAALLRQASLDPAEREAMITRRLAGEPLETVLGWAEVDGVRVAARRGVFVPRRRTALLAREAGRLLPSGGILVDLCCGSGFVAAHVLSARPDVTAHSCDVDADAVECAALTVVPLGGLVHQGDLFDALPPGLRGRVDVVTANAPYVPSDAVSTLVREARDHEPMAALDGGADGADLHRRIAEQAPQWLAAGGALLVETGADVTSRTLDAISAAGLRATVVHDADLSAQVAVGSR